jgi:hypothetical protein
MEDGIPSYTALFPCFYGLGHCIGLMMAQKVEPKYVAFNTAVVIYLKNSCG